MQHDNLINLFEFNINVHLVDAYLARLSLDYLVGFTLSPVLWRKLPGSRSAGRVQSVALRMVVEREHEITKFQTQEYWSIKGMFHQGVSFEASLVQFQGEKLGKLDISSEDQANQWKNELQKHKYHIQDIQKKRVQRHPQAPFITSSLQQEASRKFGYSPSRTMQIAQQLYEGIDIQGETLGLSTYMRTDSPTITESVIQINRSHIQRQWGKEYLCPTIRQYKTKKHSQEAHEAIRPTDIARTPKDLKSMLTQDQWALYKLIWDRTVASQMASAQYDQTTASIISDKGDHLFRATGSVLVFDGFLTLYDETREEEETDESHKILPSLKENQPADLVSIEGAQHFTQPPPRYSEASLIKALEDQGIGRPSTYARILQVLKDRGYVVLEKKRLLPKELGVLVTAFLGKFFSRYVDYGFTADMEDQLDQVSSGHKPWKQVLRDFWPSFIETIESSQSLKIADVLASIEDDVIGSQKESCPRCQQGTLSLRLSKTGPFLACSLYPECTYSQSLEDEGGSHSSDPMVIGQHPDTQEDIIVKKGPYGWYVQHQTTRASLPPSFSPETIHMDQALWLLSLPKLLGAHPETGGEVRVGIGRFGPYVKYEGTFFSIKNQDPEDVSLEDAVTIITQGMAKKKKTKALSETTPRKTAQKASLKKSPVEKTSKAKVSKKSIVGKAPSKIGKKKV
jgi:DNA topoisomerase-1